MTWRVLHRDSLRALPRLPEASGDAVVTDPPYGWKFMGKAWDAPDINRLREEYKRHDEVNPHRRPPCMAAGKYDQRPSANRQFQEWTAEWAAGALRALKPGGYLLAFCGPRTFHRMASGVEDAGFEIRDVLAWLFGGGFPKSHNIAKALAKAGAHPNLVADWKGWGTALKPSWEGVVVARRPLDGTVAENVREWGTGGVHVDACRVEAPAGDRTDYGLDSGSPGDGVGFRRGMDGRTPYKRPAGGRWPPNVLLDQLAAEAVDAATGYQRDGVAVKSNTPVGKLSQGATWRMGNTGVDVTYGAGGGASRFYYVAKASKADRGKDNLHPTVKPVELMRWLVRLVTPQGGLVLDPFTGSGTTGVACGLEGLRFLGIEREAEYVPIARERCAAAYQQALLF